MSEVWTGEGWERAALRLASGGRGGPGGPQIGAESSLQVGDGGQVGPDLAVQDGGDGRVVNAGAALRSAQAHPVQRSSEVDCQPPRDFGGGVGAGGVGPAVDEVRGGGAAGAGHGSSVGRPRLRVVPSQASRERPLSVGPSLHTGGRNQRREVSVATAIADYTPDIPKGEWAVIEAFVRGAVTDCGVGTPYSARELLVVAARLVWWCWRTAGLPLDRGVIFHRDTIAEYIAHGCPQMSPASAGNRRSQLLRMSELLLPLQQRTSRLAPLPPSDALPPYPPAEVVALRSWANGQNTQYRCEQCNLLLALGLGAGLSNAEILSARAEHIRCDEAGVLVEVTGRRARFVPVLASWESALVDYASIGHLNPKQFVFRPRRTSSHSNTIGNFVDKVVDGRVHPTAQRMRVTWMVTHLAAGTPVKPLIVAAGLDSLEALTRYLQFVPDADITQIRREFRAVTGGAATQ